VQRSEYYAAIAMSMSKSFSNLFFGAIDPSGSVTLDKIPGSYWIPAILVRIFGFSTWAITVPNALAAIALVIVVAKTAKLLFGNTAGLIAAGIIATTPIITAVSRSNQPQSFFLLTLAIASFYAAKAFTLESRKYLIISGAFIALAFHTYMLEAWAIWPAIIIAWFFTARPIKTKFVDLLIAGSISLGLSLTWISIVWLVPKSHRPYIGGTYHNNPFEMVFGYNGLGRFSGTSTLSSATDDPTFRSFTPPFGGHAGFGRIFSSAVAGQIAWLIPAAFVSIAFLAILRQRKTITIFLGGWLLTFFIMFSMVAGIHQFYTSSLALPAALLIGGGLAKAIELERPALKIALVTVTSLTAFYIASQNKSYLTWVVYRQAAIAILAVVLLAIHGRDLRKFAIPAVLMATVLTPGAWAVDVHSHSNSINPIAGNGDSGFGGPGRGGFHRDPRGGFTPPQGFTPPKGFTPPNGFTTPQGFTPPKGFTPPTGGMPMFGQQDNSATIAYLKANRGSAKYLLATFGAQSASSFITATGENVLPIGGFDGSDPTPSVKSFIAMVNAGEIKYVSPGTDHMDGAMNNTPAKSQSTVIAAWVKSHCAIDANAPISLYKCSAN
jgi:4-amino-4-deoxy-L-arabinose transferase-like glycosyltransferase